jgi:GNAT superfamily N-acetyltransferase
MTLREATADDFDGGIWPFFRQIAEAGDTYAYPRDIGIDAARVAWIDVPRKTFVWADEESHILGSYYIKTNHAGPGSHVCNCGYMVAPEARGRGIAAAMCEHSQQVARELGYAAMQFNFVASSNTGAVRLWSALGFVIVGRLPLAFRHPELGDVDALVMFKRLVP